MLGEDAGGGGAMAVARDKKVWEDLPMASNDVLRSYIGGTAAVVGDGDGVRDGDGGSGGFDTAMASMFNIASRPHTDEELEGEQEEGEKGGGVVWIDGLGCAGFCSMGDFRTGSDHDVEDGVDTDDGVEDIDDETDDTDADDIYASSRASSSFNPCWRAFDLASGDKSRGSGSRIFGDSLLMTRRRFIRGLPPVSVIVSLSSAAPEGPVIMDSGTSRF